MKAPSGKFSLAIATLLVAIGSLAADGACSMTGDDSAASSSTDGNNDATGTVTVNDNKATFNEEEYLSHCHIWPPTGTPPEHMDYACNRALQNAAWVADFTAAQVVPKEDLIPDTVYLNMPEEKTWVCPLDSTTEESLGRSAATIDVNKGNSYGGVVGHPTRWIIHNEATSPIVLTHVNALGLEVSAIDFKAFPAHSNTAVFPHGPIVLPGQLAVVEGRQGQTFIAREYKEVLPMNAMMDANNAEAGGSNGVEHSWKSFKSVLPPTLSFLPEQTRFVTNKGVWHVLGHPGTVLMKHRMGNIFVKNQFGALCPLNLEEGIADDGRRGTPMNMDPDCNVLRKAFINKVGCSIDISFAARNKIEGFNCEKFSGRLGPLNSFLKSPPDKRNIDGHKSPFKFENTYNGHSFIARMSHDHSLVARINLDHDVVKDCPEPSSTYAGAEVQVDERMMQGVLVDTMLPMNGTKSSHSASSYNEWLAGAKVNATAASPIISGSKPRYEKPDTIWHNRTSTILASLPIAS